MDSISCLGKLRFGKNLNASSFKMRQKERVLKKSRSGNNCHTPNRLNQPLSVLVDIHEKLDLEKLV